MAMLVLRLCCCDVTVQTVAVALTCNVGYSCGYKEVLVDLLHEIGHYVCSSVHLFLHCRRQKIEIR